MSIEDEFGNPDAIGYSPNREYYEYGRSGCMGAILDFIFVVVAIGLAILIGMMVFGMVVH